MSLRLNEDEADRIKKICTHTEQTISDFIRLAVRERIENEEVRILRLQAERLKLEKELKGLS